ncbi:uncharacterized protein LOC119578947 [Penaeus monodon]|uniref:uncharacterized protein LOC119578947 n=1 Tax=Penaeus monodon TaxID=6687 RepID=UPI0018A6EB9A|nr:uncharacterized protein LOC119578947 [Penaeus monodon]
MSRPAEPKLPPPRQAEFLFDDWTIKVTKSHIMGSQCEVQGGCDESLEPEKLCNLCRYEHILRLPSLPDMVFADNTLKISHKGGGSIKFSALDALQCVNVHEENLQVAHAEAWKEARSDCEFAQKVVKPYDWTFTTDFRGLGGEIFPRNFWRFTWGKFGVCLKLDMVRFEVSHNVCWNDMVRISDVSDHMNTFVVDTICIPTCNHNSFQVDASVYKDPDVVWQHLPLVTETVDKLVVV